MDKIIAEWKHALKFYSVWAFALLTVAPDIYQMARAAGLLEADGMPQIAAWMVRGLALAGLVSRFVKQTKPADDSDQAGA